MKTESKSHIDQAAASEEHIVNVTVINPKKDKQAKSKTMNLSFGEAYREMENGNKVARQGWNGKNMYIWIQEKSSPLASKCRNMNLKQDFREDEHIHINSHVDMKMADDSILIGWTPSQIDMQKKDWYIIL